MSVLTLDLSALTIHVDITGLGSQLLGAASPEGVLVDASLHGALSPVPSGSLAGPPSGSLQ